MIYSSRGVSMYLESGEPEPYNIGITIGRLDGKFRRNGALFVPRADKKIISIKQGMNLDLSIDNIPDRDQLGIYRRQDKALYLILSSALCDGDGRGAIYALKDQYHDYLAKARCAALQRHWGEVLLEAQPLDAFFLTWKSDGEITANQLIYVDEHMEVHAMSQEQAYLHFNSNGLDVPFHFNVRNGYHKARVMMAEWYKIL